MLKALFWTAAAVGRPFWGLRPRRAVHWLARAAYGTAAPRPDEFRWFRDRWGLEMALHPHYVIDYQIIAFGGYEIPLRRLIERQVRPGMVCLDVGANIGAVGIHLARKVGEQGQVHCFEPVPHLRSRLRANVERNQVQRIVRIHQAALSDVDGSGLMFIHDQFHVNQGMSVLDRSPGRSADEAGMIAVETTTLDRFVRAAGIDRVDLIKVDIQGAEPLFLRGAAETLKAMRPELVIEVSPSCLAAFGSTNRALAEALEALGYAVHTIETDGSVGRRIDARALRPGDEFSNVYCRPDGPARR